MTNNKISYKTNCKKNIKIIQIRKIVYKHAIDDKQSNIKGSGGVTLNGD